MGCVVVWLLIAHCTLQCVLLDFDRSVWHEVTATTATSWFARHLLLSEGSLVQCPQSTGHQLCRLHDVAWLTSRLVDAGILFEVPGPGQLLRLLEHEFHAWLAANASAVAA